MEVDKELQNQNPNPNPNSQINSSNDHKDTNQSKVLKGKSCKGCLYYSSTLKSNSLNPICIGIPRNLREVPRYIVGETELEASKEGRTLRDFKYGCVGYSVFLENKDSSTDKQGSKAAELPFCVGLEVLLDRSPSTADHAPAPAPAPAHVRKSEESHAFPQPQPQPQPRTYKPAPFPGDEYWSRFKRNAGLVAAGVAKNVNKVGNHIKETLEDILYPYRRK